MRDCRVLGADRAETDAAAGVISACGRQTRAPHATSWPCTELPTQNALAIQCRPYLDEQVLVIEESYQVRIAGILYTLPHGI